MNAQLERIARTYRPLYLRGALVEGGWMHHRPRQAPPPPPKRFTLVAWVAAFGPWLRRGSA